MPLIVWIFIAEFQIGLLYFILQIEYLYKYGKIHHELPFVFIYPHLLRKALWTKQDNQELERKRIITRILAFIVLVLSLITTSVYFYLKLNPSSAQ